MANFNKVILVGRLTRDIEAKTFGSGGKVAKFGFAVSSKKKNASGQYEEDPMFIDVECFNNGNNKTADVVEKYCKKGSQIMVEGKLKLDQWDDKNGGGKRSKHKIVADSIQLLDGKREGAPAGGSEQPASNGGGASEEHDPGSIPF